MTAFASANSRNAVRPLSNNVSEERAASKNPLSSDVVESEKREGKNNGMSNRRPGREDREEWQNNKQRRHLEQEEGDGRPRKNGDREKSRWDREAKDQEAVGDAKRTSRDPARRDGRDKFEQPWFRNDKAQSGGDDATKALAKQHVWRRERGSERGPEGDRSFRPEQDPEWMDSTVSTEPGQVHTQEDFQRWKESMKAGAEGGDKVSEQQETTQQPETKKPDPPPMPAFLEVSEVESGMDKFFAFYGNGKTSSEQRPAEIKAHRKPRFAALFSPQPEDGPKGSAFMGQTEMAQASILPTTQSAAAPTDANKADQEHFQRVLQMLAGRSSNNTPQSANASKAPKDPTNREELYRQRDESKSPLAELLQKRDQGHVEKDSSRDRISAGMYESPGGRALEAQQRVPREPTPNRDADLLLRLMQQARIAQDSKASQAPPPEALGSTTEISALSTSATLQMPVKRTVKNPPVIVYDPAISQMQRPEQAPTLPPGMQRPPGFDHTSALVPGWPNSVGRSVNAAAYAAGPAMPSSHIMQLPHQQMPLPQRQRKYTGDGIGPGHLLGMGPSSPPGFINAPPPGYPTMAPMRGRGVGPVQQFPDGNGMLPRHLMEMLASGQRGEARDGGGGMPGHYR